MGNRIFALLLFAVLLAARGATAATRTLADFGIIGDGQADDTAAIQMAVDSGMGSIVLPPGSYKLTRTVTIRLDKTGFTSLTSDGTARVIMAGPGPAFHFIGTHAGSADPAQVKPEVWARQRMPIVRSIEIVGAHDAADGLEFSGVMQVSVSETIIRECRHAIHLTLRNRNLTIANCHLYHNRGIGIFYDQVDLHQSNIVGCHISYNGGGGVVTRGGNVRNLQIGTCDIESNMSPDGSPTSNVLIDCTGGSTGEIAITGCTIQHNSKSPGSANIRVLGRGRMDARRPEPTQEGHLTITGNILSDVMINIHLEHVRGASISGNTIWEGFTHDLLVEHCQGIVLGANDFDRNPRYVVNGNWAKDLNGLVFRDSADCKLSGFLVKGVWGKSVAVSLEKCRRFTVRDLSILDCDGIGLRLKDCMNCRVSDCRIRDDREPKRMTTTLRVEGGKGNVIRK